MENKFNKQLSDAFDRIKKKSIEFKSDTPLAISKEKIAAAKHIEKTSIHEEILQKIVNSITTVPPNFYHPNLKSLWRKEKRFN